MIYKLQFQIQFQSLMDSLKRWEMYFNFNGKEHENKSKINWSNRNDMAAPNRSPVDFRSVYETTERVILHRWTRSRTDY